MAEESVRCPKCDTVMESWVGDSVRCPNTECKVTVLPMAQFRAKRFRDQLFLEGKLRDQKPKTMENDGNLVAALIAAQQGPKPWG